METKIVRKYLLECEHCKKQKKRVIYRKDFDDKLICDNCYKLFINHPINENIPGKGEVAYDEQGRLICHICGRVYDKLTAHIKQYHKITPDEYKEMFELNRTFSLTSERFKEKCRENIKKNDSINQLRHFKKGEKNYITKDGSIAAAKKRRLQYVKNRVNTKYNKTNEDND